MTSQPESTTLLGADIGGTKSLLGQLTNSSKPVQVQQFNNSQFPGLDAILQQYLQNNPALNPANTILTLGIAGPVDGHRCQMTNLPWLIDGIALQQRFGFQSVHLLNDLAATAWAIPDQFEQEALHFIHGSQLDFTQPVAVISVGTGMGQAVIVPDHRDGLRVLGTEGGHKQFAPFDLHSARLLQQAYAGGQTSISWENWFSGCGLPHLYRAMFPDLEVPANETLSVQAQTQPESPAAQCMTMLVSGIFAEAGNLALQTLSWGGVIFAGGLVKHTEHLMKGARPRQYFTRKSEYVERLQNIPLALCTDPQVALAGALAYSKYQQIRGN